MIPRSAHPDMRTDAIVYATDKLMEAIRKDRSLEQAVHVAMLPGIVGPALAMPDIHQGYGFPIGGVAAIDEKTGVVSPGGVGFDINCGVRLLGSKLGRNDVIPKLKELIHQIFRDVPSGAGVSGKILISREELDDVLERGAQWAVERGMGTVSDLDHTEERGCLGPASAAAVSERAKQRGRPQLGTLGSGNHFLEVQYVDEIFDGAAAGSMGLRKDQVVVLIHTGSRGLGHQVCTDFLADMGSVMRRYNIRVPDRQLACAPILSIEGQNYLRAMAAAANFAWTNRQCIAHATRKAFERLFGRVPMPLVYDVAHNIAKMEEHEIDGVRRRVLVHRKGATRAFPGQPVLIPGSMGTASYVLIGQPAAMEKTFGSACHGAGRSMSRTRARAGANAKEIQSSLARQGIMVEAVSRAGITEERPEAYKDIEMVVDVVHAAGIASKVARLRPLGVVKG